MLGVLMAFMGANGGATAQTDIPPFGPVFLQEEVATVDITMDPDSLDAMLFGDVGYAASNPFPATFHYISTVIDTVIDTTAIRLRGNTSLAAPKKSFKIDLNAFIPGQKFADLEKLNLNANQNDPSILRAALSWNILRRMGLAGSRTSMVKLMLNGQYMGLYVNTEHMDEEFVEEYYDKDGGNFYKCLWPATLEYISDAPDDTSSRSTGAGPTNSRPIPRRTTTPTSQGSSTCSTTRPMVISRAPSRRSSTWPISSR